MPVACLLFGTRNSSKILISPMWTLQQVADVERVRMPHIRTNILNLKSENFIPTAKFLKML
jgi:hypothetical protein